MQFDIKNSLIIIAWSFFYFTAIVFFQACNPTKRLKEKEYLLTRNIIVDRSASLFKLNPDIQKSEFEGYIKQKPNRKVLGVRFHLFLYNRINPEKALVKKQKRDERYERINKARLFKAQQENKIRETKGLPPKIPRLKDTERLTWREWMMDIGEPPVIFDSAMMVKSAQQLRMFLSSKGYFNNNVKDSVVKKNKKAAVYYFITPNKPYRIRSITYKIPDPLLEYYVFSDTSQSFIVRGKNYDADVLQRERERITRSLRNTGYYNFSRDYIYYKVDSSLNANEVNIELHIRKNLVKPVDSDTLIETNHQRYEVENIYIITDYNPKVKKAYADTVEAGEYKILYSGKLNFKPKVIADAMFIKQGLYQVDDVDDTYKRLSELRAFKFIDIHFENGNPGYLDCYIKLTPIMKQSFTVETEGSNTGGNLGVNGSFVYQNRNVFKGAEVFEMRLKGGLVVQKLLTKDNESQIISGSGIPFNTIEFGPEASIIVPRFLLPVRLNVSLNSNPKTIFKVGYNYQQRPDYTRGAMQVSYGFNWKETRTKKHFIFPLEINLVSFVGKKEFETYLSTINDPLLVYRFTDHFTTDFRYMFNYSDQNISRVKSFTYFKAGAESSGNLLRGIYNLLDQYVTPMPQDNGSYTIDNIKFSQYLRADIDYRYNMVFSQHTRLVLRFAAGIGKPLHNLRVLPLEKSFFGGGPNDIRAWKARTLGPGSFSAPNQTNFDKVGDNQIETNIEYRFNIVRILNAAAFVDAGNIWLRRPDPNRPGGEIKPNLETLDEFAIGVGLGIRLDFNFFIIRFDAAVPVKDPAYPKGDRWTFNKQPLTRTNLNFGIGYPF